MSELEDGSLKKVLTALLLVQMGNLSESEQIGLLIKSGWSNTEIAQVTGLSENAIGIRKSRLKKSAK